MKYNGGSAFPIPLDNSPGAYSADPGMTLRDYFAAKALVGMLANDGPEPSFPSFDKLAASMAEVAYQYADAMLAERDK